MSTQFRPIEIPPGVVSMPTKQQRSSNWAETNLMRWIEGQLTPIGGWLQFSYSFLSRCKRIHGWYALNGEHFTAYLCEQHLYVDIAGVLHDITPSGGITSPAPTGDGGYGDGLYGYGMELVAAGTISTSSPNITMTPNPGWVRPTMDVYNMTTSQHVGTVLTYVGSNLVLTANAEHAGSSSSDLLMFDWYGFGRPTNTISLIETLPDVYSLDNFGQVLYAMTSVDGRLLKWDPSVGGLAIEQPADPTGGGRGPVPRGRMFVITPQRFIIVFGAEDTTNGGSFRRFAWCDQENPGAWDYTNVTSQAGFLDVEPASPIVAAEASAQGILFWTATTTYIANFLGLPYVYNYVEIAKNCTPWSPHSITSTASMLLWFSQQGLFSYNGAAVLPVACKVRPWVDDDIDITTVRQQACAVHVEAFNEFWWFFPQNGQAYNTRVIVYNYKEGWWSMGQCARSAGVVGAYTLHTTMADGKIAYTHEVPPPWYYPNSPLPWAQTFDLNLNSGANLTTVKQMIPDIGGDASNVLYSLLYRSSRSVMPDPAGGSNPVTVIEQQTIPRKVRADGYVDFRTTARDLRLKIELAHTGVTLVTVGQHLVDAVPRGQR